MCNKADMNLYELSTSEFFKLKQREGGRFHMSAIEQKLVSYFYIISFPTPLLN